MTEEKNKTEKAEEPKETKESEETEKTTEPTPETSSKPISSITPAPIIKSAPKSETVTFKKETLWKTSTFVLLAVVLVLVGVNYIGNDSGSPTGAAIAPSGGSPTANPPSADRGAPPTPGAVSATADDDAFLGDENAPITLIEFSDYQCPFCSRFWSQTLPQIKSQYIESGKVKFVYRDFPLDSIHPLATPAALAAECVREQGGDEGYFEYHDLIFGNQPALSDSSLRQWAQDLGYDINECLDSQKFLDEVKGDLADATAAGGRGTPFFVVIDRDGNGVPISGAQPFSAFQSAFEAALA